MTVMGLVAAAVFAAAAGAASVPRFSAPVTLFTGRSTVNVVPADLNGDGAPDLVTVDALSDGVSVLLGRGDGSFRERLAFPTAPVPLNAAVADVDGDGDQDVVTASRDGHGSITVLRNDGAGRLRRDRTYPAHALSLAAADLNGDGLLDLVTVSFHRRGVAVMLGVGGGRFAPARRFAGSRTAVGVALGDIDADGDADAVLGTGTDGGRVIVRLGNGDGTFGPEATFRAGWDLFGVTLADLNHDGRLDLATADYDVWEASIFLGAGDGTFGAKRAYPMGGQPDTVVVADFDGDGHPDIATGSDHDNPALRSGRGDGTFGKAQYLPWSIGSGGATADFNRDGRPDLAFGQYDDRIASVFLNWTGLPEPPCVVLNVTEWPLRKAERYLRHGNCSLGRISRAWSHTMRRDRVISQRPPTGAVLPSSSTVDLVVSRGRRR
jgi:hypothetical protein